jgi:hypothetical protein
MTSSLILSSVVTYVRGNFTSVLFVFVPPVINVEIDLSSRVSILWCKTKHLTFQKNKNQTPHLHSSSYVCSRTGQYVSVSCWLLRLVVALICFQREQLMALAKLCIILVYALTSFWHRFSDSNIWAFHTVTSPQWWIESFSKVEWDG